MINKFIRIGCSCSLVFITTACVHLKAINDYAEKSASGIKKFEDLRYGFQQYCVESCTLEAMRRFDIRRTADCNCSLYKTADSVSLIIFQSLKKYFDGLTALSDNDKSKTAFNTLQKSLTTGEFGSIQINDTDVKAYGTIANILFRASTDVYRRNKIKMYIADANEALQVLLQKFQFILEQNLGGELNIKKEKLYTYYKELSLSARLSDFEKGHATKDYYDQLESTNEKQAQIKMFVKGLKAIGLGHQQLYEKRNQLNAKAIQAQIKQYASDIQEFTAAFNKLNN